MVTGEYTAKKGEWWNDNLARARREHTTYRYTLCDKYQHTQTAVKTSSKSSKSTPHSLSDAGISIKLVLLGEF